MAARIRDPSLPLSLGKKGRKGRKRHIEHLGPEEEGGAKGGGGVLSTKNSTKESFGLSHREGRGETGFFLVLV